jgi:hypothetical protein
MSMNDRKPETPHDDGGRSKAPTPQGFGSAGPGNAHGLPPDRSSGDAGSEARPFTEGRPAADPEAMARRVLDQARKGPPAEGDAGPLGAQEK